MPELGRYAFAVLTSYGAALALLSGLIVYSVLRAKRVLRQLREAEARRGPTQ